MIQPTILPCQHTFCFHCLQNLQQTRTGSLPVYSNSHSLSNENQITIITCQTCSRTHRINSLHDLEENRSIEFLINTLLCETCQKLFPSNQLDTCLHCFEVLCPNCYDDHLHSHEINSKSSQNKSSIEQVKPSSPLIEKENLDLIQSKKKNNSFLRRIIHPARHRRNDSSSSTKSNKQIECVKKVFRSKSTSPVRVEPKQPTTPVTPVRKFLNLHDQYEHTSEHIAQSKQRQSELDFTVKKLIEMLTVKTNENLQQISIYWLFIKKQMLQQYQTKQNRFSVFDYLMNKTCCSSDKSQKQIELYLERNDEIHACLQVLSTTVGIIAQQENSVLISQFFDREEQTTVRSLKRQLENLLSAYADEVSFIIERIRVYETRFSSWKDSNPMELESIAYEWTQIIEHDYPSIIERISNDFINQIPQLEKILIRMLTNMKIRLLNVNNQPTSRRSSES